MSNSEYNISVSNLKIRFDFKSSIYVHLLLDLSVVGFHTKMKNSSDTNERTPEIPQLTTPCSVQLEKISLANNSSLDYPYICENSTKLSEPLVNNYRSRQSRLFDSTTPKTSIEFSLELKKVINERNILTSKTRKRVFEALDEIKTKSEDDTRHFKREKVLLEIMNTEIKYVHQLEIIINFFLKPTEDRKLLKQDDFRTVFGHINTICNVNRELLQELEKGYSNVPKAFAKLAPFFKLYSAYAYDFKYILLVLQVSKSLYASENSNVINHILIVLIILAF